MEYVFQETAIGKKKKTKGGIVSTEQTEGLNEDQKKKFDTLVDLAGDLEKEINALISAFEKKHKVSCWVSAKKHNKVLVDVAADLDTL